MLTLIIRRISGSLLVLVLVSFLTYALLDLAPGDAAQVMAGETATKEQLALARQQMGLDLPVYLRFERFAEGAILHGDLGKSLSYGLPVSTLVAQRFGYTLLLALVAMALAVALGLACGWLAARRQGSWLDFGLMALASLGVAVPGFWLAMLLVMLFSVRLGWLPVVGAGTPAHLVLPAICLALPTAASIARLARASLLDACRADYVHTAQAKGLNRRQVWGRHILPNSLIPILTLIGLNLGHLLGGAFVIETVFGWPGLGRLVVQAIFDRDFPVIVGAVLLIAAIYLALNLIVDLLQALIDPRARQEALVGGGCDG